ncbi:MAG: hypothetical protein OXH61_15025 [Acidimicrobiaceae bacterium]|nr:hypothetical protein [Acidimicrobiaceae bacterium]
MRSVYEKAEESLVQELKATETTLAEELTASQGRASDAADEAETHRDAASKTLQEIERLLNISTDTAWGGTYDSSAAHDQKTANNLRSVAFLLYAAATLVGIGFAGWNASNAAEGWEWLSRLSLGGGPVAVLLFAASYASRESSEHRNSSRLLKHQSLAFISLDKYAERIDKMAQDDSGQSKGQAAKFLSEISSSLFTKQIDAHIDQIKAHGRGGRTAWRIRGRRTEDPA